MAIGMVDLTIMMGEPAASNWVQIMKTGKWAHPKHGDIEITPTNLVRFKDNFDKKVRGVDLAMDVAHEPDKGSVAWFKELKIDGDKLMAKVDWTDEGAQLVKSGKYRYFSPEFMFSWTDNETGQQYHDVLFGGALTNRPFLKGMEPVEFAEGGYGTLWFAENEPYDPDHDGDDDSTTDPEKNPDWLQDVLAGITKWPDNRQQQEQLRKVGAKKAACDAAYDVQHRGTHTMSEPNVTNAHKSPPKGKPTNKALYADPENYKYPIDKKHVHAAVSYYNHDGMQEKGGYTASQWEAIGHRIAKAAGEGYSLKDGKIVTPSTHKMSDTYDPDDSPDDDGTDPSPTHPTDDKDAGKFNEPGGKHMDEKVVSLAEHTAMVEKVKLLEEESRRVKMSERVNGFMFNEQTKKGKIMPAQQDKVLDLMLGLNDDQVAKFEEVINGLPDAITFGDERGHGMQGQAKPREQMVADRAEVLLSEGKAKTYKEAIVMADDEIPNAIK